MHVFLFATGVRCETYENKTRLTVILVIFLSAEEVWVLYDYSHSRPLGWHCQLCDKRHVIQSAGPENWKRVVV
jgi:hypothetical protein